MFSFCQLLLIHFAALFIRISRLSRKTSIDLQMISDVSVQPTFPAQAYTNVEGSKLGLVNCPYLLRRS